MIKIAGIENDSIVDGPGIRTVFFCQGCPHHCIGCHNEETWDFSGGTLMDEDKLFKIVKNNPLCRKVTFSGGEPFAQAAGFAKLAKKLRESGYEVASYSGYTFEELLNGTAEQMELLSNIDILIDGRFILEKRSLDLNFRGSTNQRIIDVPKSLIEKKAILTTDGRWLGEY